MNTGLLASDNEAELAGILAHEIAHLNCATCREDPKASKDFTSQRAAGVPIEVLGFIFPMKSQRDAERGANWLGLEYENTAGYDPETFLSFVERVQARQEQDYTALG